MHPMLVTKELVRSLRDDPVATSQLKEQMSVAELMEMLDIPDGDLAEYINKHRREVVQELNPSDRTD
jgi:hypothetical protein